MWISTVRLVLAATLFEMYYFRPAESIIRGFAFPAKAKYDAIKNCTSLHSHSYLAIASNPTQESLTYFQSMAAGAVSKVLILFLNKTFQVNFIVNIAHRRWLKLLCTQQIRTKPCFN